MRALQRALKEAGAVLIRHKRHDVYRLPNGRIVSFAQSPSDSARGERNALRDLKRALNQPRQ